MLNNIPWDITTEPPGVRYLERGSGEQEEEQMAVSYRVYIRARTFPVACVHTRLLLQMSGWWGSWMLDFCSHRAGL